MDEKKKAKLEFAKNNLNEIGIIFQEFANGQLQVDKINYWSTTEKWYDTKNGESGIGINSFIKQINKE